jgi:hypothetical protein
MLKLSTIKSIFMCLLAASNVAFGDDDCNSLLDPLSGGAKTSLATLLEVKQRAELVAQCFEVADSTVSQAYKMSFSTCENMAETFDEFSDIPFGSQSFLPQIPSATNWDDYLLGLGDYNQTGGCRDGLKSALLKKSFATTSALNDFLKTNKFEAGVQFPDPPKMSLPANSSIEVSGYSFEGNIPKTGKILEIKKYVFELQRGEFAFAGTLNITARNPFFTLPVGPKAEVRGAISGVLDLKNMTFLANDFALNEMSLLNEIPFIGKAFDISKLNSQNFMNNDFKFALSASLTSALQTAYRSVNPFEMVRISSEKAH